MLARQDSVSMYWSWVHWARRDHFLWGWSQGSNLIQWSYWPRGSSSDILSVSLFAHFSSVFWNEKLGKRLLMLRDSIIFCGAGNSSSFKPALVVFTTKSYWFLRVKWCVGKYDVEVSASHEQIKLPYFFGIRWMMPWKGMIQCIFVVYVLGSIFLNYLSKKSRMILMHWL